MTVSSAVVAKRTSRGWIPLMILLGLAVGGGGAAWIVHPPPYSPPVVPGLVAGGHPGSVRLENATVPLTWIAGDPATAAATIRNVSGSNETAQVWWFLAKIGLAAPWRDPIVTSSIVSTRLHPSQIRTVPIPPATIEEQMTPGTYALSMWVHVLDPATGTYLPSDGRSLKATISVVATPNVDVRRFMPGVPLMISEAHLLRSPTVTDPGLVEATIVNRTTSVQGAAIWTIVAPPGSRKPWTNPHGHRSSIVEAVVAPGGSTSVDLPADWPSSGLGEVSVWVHRLTVRSSTHEDGIWLRNLVR
ncbi:MAG: hypothetical protein ACRDVP_10850 [Acidimicrobiales bacterium]